LPFVVKKLKLIDILQKGLVSGKKLLLRFMTLVYNSDSKDQFTEVMVEFRR
jgi:hypothetical protein